LAREKRIMPEDQLDKTLDARRMTQPQEDMVGSGGG